MGCNCSYCTYYTIIQGSNRLFEWAFEIGAVLRTVLLVRSMDGAQAAIQSFVKFCVARCAEFCTARTVGFLFALSHRDNSGTAVLRGGREPVHFLRAWHGHHLLC